MNPELSPDPRGNLEPRLAQQLADVVITALEGGIMRWVKSAALAGTPPPRRPREAASERIARLLLTGLWELRLELEEPPIDGGAPHVHLTLPGLLWGIHTAANRAGRTVAAWLDEHDAHSADDAIQYALFGHLIYN